MTIEVAYAESIDIGAPPASVFAHRLDFMNLPDYMNQASGIRRTDGGTDPGPGADYAFDLTIPGMGAMEAYIKVLEVDAPHRIVFDTGSSGMGGREVSTFTELPDGGTHVEFAFSMSLPDEAAEGVSFVEDSGRSSFRGELEGLKKFFEGG
ncbi:MAG: SRPBCC family protein [Actinomycetota bacterium]